MIKNILKKILYKNRATSKTYINYLRKIGCSIGENTKIYSPRNVIIDEQKPWLIEIGSNVQITDGVRILTHDYAWSVLKLKYGIVLGSAGKVKIGNNVFIGVNSTVLKGVTIGDNIIIGANSLVNKDCLIEGVYGGNPIRFIMSLEEYRSKRINCQLNEAYQMAVEYYKKYNSWPEESLFREFFWLFKNDISNNPTFIDVMMLEGNYYECYNNLKNNNNKFNNFDEFIDYVKDRYLNEK